ncbi:MAG: hypothetical protein ACLSH6_08090 [Limosilactobacillus pontis]
MLLGVIAEVPLLFLAILSRYYKLWRAAGSDEWHFVDTNEVADIISPADRPILKRVEESFRAVFRNTDITEDQASVPADVTLAPTASQAPARPAPETPPHVDSATPAPSAAPADNDDNDNFLLLF